MVAIYTYQYGMEKQQVSMDQSASRRTDMLSSIILEQLAEEQVKKWPLDGFQLDTHSGN